MTTTSFIDTVELCIVTFIELRPDTFAKIRESKCFDVERERAGNLWIGVLVLAILFDRC